MLTRTHFIFSIFIFLIIFPYLEFNKIIFLIFLLIGTLLPDVDTSRSRIGRKFYFRPLQWFVKHRGIFHSLVFGLIIFGIIYSFNVSAGFGFFTGWILHLFLDCFTKAGVQVFWPIYNKKVGLRILKSGGLFEEILFVLLLLIDIFLVGRLLFIS